MTEPLEPRPTPVLDAAKLGGLVGAAFVTCGGVYFLVVEGITADRLGMIGAAITAAVTALVALAVYAASVVHGRAAQARVTPLEDPVKDGQPLLTATEWAATWGQHAALEPHPTLMAGAPAQPAGTGFPLTEWDEFTAHPYSKPKMRAAIAAVATWLNR